MADENRRSIPPSSLPTEVWTYEDAVDHLIDLFDTDRSGRDLRQARRAVLTAHRKLANLHNWKCYQRRDVISTVASQTTGTIVYDHTGGSNEREVTLTGATWPSWAEFGELQISGVTYMVEDRVSTTVLTLSERTNPGQDVAAGTSYTLFRSMYPLPPDFRRLGSVHQLNQEYQMEYVSAELSHAQSVYFYDTPSQSWTVTIREDPRYLAQLVLQLNPPPASADEYGFIYVRKPRDLVTDIENTGSVASSGTTVTGTGTAFANKHIGSIIRFGDTSDAPGGLMDLNPFVEQRTIMAVASATSLTLDAALATDAASTTKYVISDPIDIEVAAMLDAFLSLAEWEFARISDRRDALTERRNRFFLELDIARDADRRSTAVQDGNIASESYYGALGDVEPLG